MTSTPTLQEIQSPTLFNGDCLEILPTLGDNTIDLLLVDLPYGTTACKWDFVLPMDKLWEQYYRICKKNAAMIFTASQPFTTTLISSNLKHFKYEWIWEKPQGTNPMLAKHMPLKTHENVCVFYREKPTYNPQMWKSTPYSGFHSTESKGGEVMGSPDSKHRDNPEGTRYPRSVQKWKQDRKGDHPTQKPIEMMEYFIKTYSNEGDTVLDNTMGSGTTGVACKNTNRKFIGIELDSKYYEIAQKRIEKTSIIEFFT